MRARQVIIPASAKSDEERIRNLELFEEDYREGVAYGNGPRRRDSQRSLDLLDALRKRAPEARS